MCLPQNTHKVPSAVVRETRSGRRHQFVLIFVWFIFQNTLRAHPAVAILKQQQPFSGYNTSFWCCGALLHPFGVMPDFFDILLPVSSKCPTCWNVRGVAKMSKYPGKLALLEASSNSDFYKRYAADSITCFPWQYQVLVSMLCWQVHVSTLLCLLRWVNDPRATLQARPPPSRRMNYRRHRRRRRRRRRMK